LVFPDTTMTLRPGGAGQRERARALLQAGDAEELARVAAGDQRLARGLMALLYDDDPDTRHQAAAALGRVAAHAPNRSRVLLDRLWWTFADEAATFCPGAPLAIAHIALAQPEISRGFVSPLVHLLDDPGHLPDVLRSIVLLAPAFPEAVVDLPARIEPLVGHQDAAVARLAERALASLDRGRGDL
jgi:hypothetical protein